MSDPGLGAVLAASAAVFWAIGAVFARAGLQYVPSRAGTAISLFSGFSVALVIAVIHDVGSLVGVSAASAVGLLGVGLLQFPVARLLNYTAIHLAGVAPAMTVASTAPVFAASWAVLFLNESIAALVIVGTMGVVIGLIIVVIAMRDPSVTVDVPVVADPDPSRWGSMDDRVVLGLGLALLSAVGYGTVQTLIKVHADDGVDPEAGVALMAFSGMIVMSVVASGQWRQTAQAPRSGIWLMALAGVGSVLGVFFAFNALSLAPVLLVAPISSSSPLVVVGLTHLFLRRLEKVTLQMVAGVALTIVGIALVIVGQQ